MFRSIAKLFASENKDLRKRIYYTLFALGIFCLGSGITIPWASTVYEELGFLEIFNLMSGGGLKSFSIFALGVSPYITASIITQLLQMDIIPYFKELKDQGYVGRQKIQKINRYLAVIFAFIQAYVISIFYLKNVDVMVMIKTSLVMTAGTSFLLWLGDQITKKGIGNGTSLLIMAGIIESMPGIFAGAFKSFILGGTYNTPIGISLFILFIIIYLVVLIGIVWMTLAERRIPIQYANHTASYNSKKSYLPIKINSANVIPVIFASIVLTIPSTIAGLVNATKASEFIDKYIVYTTPTGFLIYIVLILFFGYVYTYMMMNPEEMSKDLNKRGGYIPGVRPGEETSKYISNSLGKLTIVGCIFLVILSGLPILMANIFKLPSSVTIGGTGILIVVGVAIETYKQIESGLVSRKYKSRRRSK